MVFSGETLWRILSKQSRLVSMFDERGLYRGSVPPLVAADLAARYGLVGIGRANRIYDMQPNATRARLNQELLRNPAARLRAPVTKNARFDTEPGAGKWKPQFDRAKSGSFGNPHTIHFRS